MASKTYNLSSPALFHPRGISSELSLYAIDIPGSVLEIETPSYESFLSEQGESLLQLALQNMENRKLKDALTISERVLQEDPLNTKANYIIGFSIAMGASEDLDHGINCLDQVIKNDTRSYRAMHFVISLVFLP